MKKYIVKLTNEERLELYNLCSSGKRASRKIRKANILLQADKCFSDDKISNGLCVGHATIERTRRRFVEGNLGYALDDFSRAGRPKKFECLNNRYLSTMEVLKNEVLAWEQQRNLRRAKVDWMFAIEDARKKMGHLYPKLLETAAKQTNSAVA